MEGMRPNQRGTHSGEVAYPCQHRQLNVSSLCRSASGRPMTAPDDPPGRARPYDADGDARANKGSRDDTHPSDRRPTPSVAVTPTPGSTADDCLGTQTIRRRKGLDISHRSMTHPTSARDSLC